MTDIVLSAPQTRGAQPDLGQSPGLLTAAAIAVAGFVSAVIGWLSFPYTAALLRAQLEEKDVAQATIERLLERSAAWRPLTWLTSPIAEAIKVAAMACLIFAVFSLADALISYRRALWIAACAELIATAKRAIVLVIISLRGVDAVQHASDLTPPLGLDLVISGGPLALRAFASFVNPFDAGTLVLLYSMSRRHSSREASAYVTATCGAILFAFRVLIMRFTS